MPLPDSGGYVSLNESSNVYNSTTEPTKTLSVLETVKKAIEHAVGKHGALPNPNEIENSSSSTGNLR